MKKIITPMLLVLLLGLSAGWMHGSAQGCTTPFLSPARIPVGNFPFSVITGDFNGDGNPDLAVTNSGDNTLSVVPGNGDGTFGTATTYGVGQYPRQLVSSDFNGDGRPDLATANSSESSVSVLTANAAGGFDAAVPYAVVLNPNYIATGDFNGDGWFDLLTSSAYFYNLSLLLNKGDGTFASAVNTPLPIRVGALTTGDFNGDGKLDVAAGSDGEGINTLLVLAGNGDGTFTTPASYTIASYTLSLLTGDFNGDGKTDIAAADARAATVSVLLNDGNGGFASVTQYEAGNDPYILAAGDFNKDGKTDLAAGNFYPRMITVLQGDGLGTFTRTVSYATESEPRSLTSGDFNKDNKPDLAIANTSSTITILEGNGAGRFGAAPVFGVSYAPNVLTAGDFNNDTKMDLAVSAINYMGPSSIDVLPGDGQGSFGTAIPFEMEDGPNTMTAADFNSDNNLDLAVGNYGGVVILQGNSNGSFAAGNSYATTGYYTTYITTGDFNGDNNKDLAVTAVKSYNTSKVAVLLGNGNGSFSTPAYITVGYFPTSIATGDFNKDTKMDMAVTLWNPLGASHVALYPGDGSGGFGTVTNTTVGNRPGSMITGDFNMDSWTDLAVANMASGDLSVLLNNGSGGFTAAGSFAAGNSPTSLVTGDFNGDGKTDLAAANSYLDQSTVALLPGDGQGNFGTATFLTAGFYPKHLTTADFNGDGSPDLATALDANSVSILLNTCSGTVTPGDILYVNKAATGLNNGMSWTNAYTSLQDALAQAKAYPNVTQIWVAAGLYYPDEGTDATGERTVSFKLKNNLALYGGFAGSETELSQRDWQNNLTTLSGDLKQDDETGFLNNGDNSYHVVWATGVDNTAVLDGFTITGGNADGEDSKYNQGGGMYNTGSSATITNCRFTANSAATYGGGMVNYSSSSSSISNCTFTDNRAANGGGMQNYKSSPNLTDCSFSGNTAISPGNSYGGGMYNLYSSPTLTRCSFTGNSADYAGAMDNYTNSSPVLTSCSFSGNTAAINGGAVINAIYSNAQLVNCTFEGNSSGTGGGGIYNDKASPTITACSFVNNSTVNYGGGIVNANSASALIINCSFTGNSAANGGAIENYKASPVITNCTFTGNTGTVIGGGIFNSTASPTITNCILWDNTGGEITNSTSTPTVSYSLVEGGYTGGTSILTKDPLFVNASSGILSLKECSPAVNAGLNGVNKTLTDLAGNDRVFAGLPDPDVIDMGAYELQAEGTGTPVLGKVAVSKAVLAPPNHKMQDITLIYTLTGGCDPKTIVTIESNEAVNGTGDGDTDPDWVVVDATHVKLRAERAAQGEGRTYTITVKAEDISGNSTTQTVEVHVSHNITTPQSGASYKIGSTVALAGTFWDKPGNRHTAKWLIDGTTTAKGVVTEPAGAKNGKVTGSYRFGAAGVYKLQMNVTDQDGVTTYANTAGDVDAIVVIYDPNGGYTYGGGYFASPAGALTSNPAATGKVSYGFAVNYFKGATYPKGETQFEFKVGEFEYNALNFEYLAIDGARAQFRGTGKIIGGQSGIDFILTAVDGALDGSGVDKVRIRIFNKNTGYVYYDNEPTLGEAANPTSKVGANSTVVIKSAVQKGMVTSGEERQPEVTGLQLQVLPNPTHGDFQVFVASDNQRDRITLQVYDQWGRIIGQQTVSDPVTRIGADYRPGTYYIRVVQGDNHREAKVIRLPY